MFTFFWQDSSPFSQWHRSKFVTDSRFLSVSRQEEFFCCEQYMMAEKARLFGDFETLDKIMKATHPRKCKELGREVKFYDDDKWNSVVKDVLYSGNYAKFTQNKSILKILLETKGKLVEASPYDKKYGIGLREDDPRAQSEDTWQGTNWLGEILTQLREDLRNAN